MATGDLRLDSTLSLPPSTTTPTLLQLQRREPPNPPPTPTQHAWKFDVFISFCGDDIRCSFADVLYQALKHNNINACKDEEDFRRSEYLEEAIREAIEGSRFSIVVFTSNYARSSYCLNELVKIMRCNSKNKTLNPNKVFPVFYDVRPDDVKNQTGPYQGVFDFRRQDGAKIEKFIKKWKKALRSVVKIIGYSKTKYRYDTKLIKKIILDIKSELRQDPISNIPELFQLIQIIQTGGQSVLPFRLYGSMSWNVEIHIERGNNIGEKEVITIKAIDGDKLKQVLAALVRHSDAVAGLGITALLYSHNSSDPEHNITVESNHFIQSRLVSNVSGTESFSVPPPFSSEIVEPSTACNPNLPKPDQPDKEERNPDKSKSRSVKAVVLDYLGVLFLNCLGQGETTNTNRGVTLREST